MLRVAVDNPRAVFLFDVAIGRNVIDAVLDKGAVGAENSCRKRIDIADMPLSGVNPIINMPPVALMRASSSL